MRSSRPPRLWERHRSESRESHTYDMNEPTDDETKFRLSMQFRNLASGGRETRGKIQRSFHTSDQDKTAQSGMFSALNDGVRNCHSIKQ